MGGGGRMRKEGKREKRIKAEKSEKRRKKLRRESVERKRGGESHRQQIPRRSRLYS